jgi:hypothetical protein
MNRRPGRPQRMQIILYQSLLRARPQSKIRGYLKPGPRGFCKDPNIFSWYSSGVFTKASGL